MYPGSMRPAKERRFNAEDVEGGKMRFAKRLKKGAKNPYRLWIKSR